MILTCLATIIFNNTNAPINSKDIQNLNRAVHVCKTDVRYKKTPCLKEFLKKDKQVYWALCGKEPLDTGN